MTRSALSSFAIVAACVTLAACASMPGGSNRVASATATISTPSGQERGTADIWQDADKVVHVSAQLTGLTPGAHGIHFHAVGNCDPSGATVFAAAGAHYNPLGRQHGMDNSAGPHAGDAPNLMVAPDGTAELTFTTDRVSLTEGSTSLFDADGSAIVIHAAADDQTSQPSGNSGARIACGVVKRTN